MEKDENECSVCQLRSGRMLKKMLNWRKENKKKKEDERFRNDSVYMLFDEIDHYLTEMKNYNLKYNEKRKQYEYRDGWAFIRPNNIFTIHSYKKYFITSHYGLYGSFNKIFEELEDEKVFKTIKYKDLEKRIRETVKEFNKENYERYTSPYQDFRESEFDIGFEKLRKNKNISIKGEKNPLVMLVYMGEVEHLNKLEKLRPDLNLNEKDSFGISPMNRAIEINKIEMVKWFLERNVDPNQKEREKCSLFESFLTRERKKGKREICSLLINYGASVSLEFLKKIEEEVENYPSAVELIIQNEKILADSQEKEEAIKKMKMKKIFVA